MKKIEKSEQISGNSAQRRYKKEKSGNLRTEKYKADDSVDGLNSGMEGTKKRAHKLEDRMIEITQHEKQKDEKENK